MRMGIFMALQRMQSTTQLLGDRGGLCVHPDRIHSNL